MNNSNLNQILFDALVNQYEKKGINVQAILRNSLFSQLPLEEKITLLKNNVESLSKTPSFSSSFKNAKPMEVALSAGLATGVGSLVGLGYKPTFWQTPLTAGAVGAALSLIPVVIAAKHNYNKDLATINHVVNNRFMDAIISRSDNLVKNPSGIKALDILQGDFVTRLNNVDSGNIPTTS